MHILSQNVIENLNYTIEYCDDNNHENITNELVQIMNDGQATEVEENDIDNIAYETVVTDDIDETQNVVQEYPEHNQYEEAVELQIIGQEEESEQSQILNDVDNTQEQENHEECTNEDMGEQYNDVEYLDDEVTEESSQEAVAQTTETGDGNESTAHSLLPVFDVYMKDGNVTGFVVNDNLITGLKDGVDKEIQTSEDVTAR